MLLKRCKWRQIKNKFREHKYVVYSGMSIHSYTPSTTYSENTTHHSEFIKYHLMLRMHRVHGGLLGFLSFNYVNPVCCVATVCHQVRCMYWGHLGYFRRAISHLKWYKIVCVRYLACTFSQMESINMFARFLQSGVPRHFLWIFIAVWT